MIYDTPDAGLAAIMFPVKEMKVFADTGPGCLARAPAYKAIVNDASGEVVSIVGSRYQVLRNRQALDLACIACVSAFPDTEPEEWIPKGIEAARNGGSCAVDLDHERLRYDWNLAPGITDVFRPFIRFRNGYNGRTPFSVFFGFERLACTNGMIYEEKIAGIKVSHDTQDIAREIERKIQKANFRRVPGTFRHRLTVLCGVPVPRDLFTPVIHRVLGIRPLKEGSNERCRRAWADLLATVENVSGRYVKEFDATAYALMNALSDLATRYPFAQGGFVRRGRHSLQILVARWLRDFSIGAGSPSFDVGEYLRELLGESATSEWPDHRLGGA